MAIPMPLDVDELEPIADALDAATREERLEWMYSLGEKQQLKLYDLAKGTELTTADLTGDEGEVLIHDGRNGLVAFNRFQKRFAKLGDKVVGYNHNDQLGGPLNPIAVKVTGPGHFLAYDSPETGREVWIDYRQVPEQQHPDFPPLINNDNGLRSLVFGNMVDILRRVSNDIYIGNAFKDLPPIGDLTLGMKIGSMLPTAPFVLHRP